MAATLLMTEEARADAAPPGMPALEGPAPDAQHRRLRHLFRHALASGQVNPLLLIVPGYRAEQLEQAEQEKAAG